jgi:two-component system, cell cycle response regulator DivK
MSATPGSEAGSPASSPHDVPVGRRIAAAPEAPTQLPPLILLVDDDQASREGMTEFLVEHGFRVVGAADGLEALDKAEHRRPDIVLLDLAIPRLDGWAVARRLRTEARFRNVPVVAVSAMDYPDEVARAMEAGCCAFVTKPCDLGVLIDTIDRVLEVVGRRTTAVEG